MMMMAYSQELQRRKVSFSFSSNCVEHIKLHAHLSWFCFLLFSALCASTNHVHRPLRAIYLLLMVTVWQTSIVKKFYFEAIRAAFKTSLTNHVLQNLLAFSRQLNWLDRRLRFFFSINWTINSFRDWIVPWFNYVSVKSKLQHAPPGQPPGHLTFLKIIVQIPPTRAKMPFKCPTLGSIQVIKCPHPGDISQAQKWQKNGGNAFSCRTKSL